MFPVIDVAGAPFERGQMHGKLARDRVERSLANYARLFAHCGIEWNEAQRRAEAWRDPVGSLDAGLLEEMEGIAAGAGRAPAEILVLNARTELLPASFLGKPVGGAGECTAVAVQPAASAVGTTLLAQNWDWLGAQRDALILLRVAESEHPAFLTLTEAGMLAKIGMNMLGFGVCLNILRSVDDGKRVGVPVHVLLRALLRMGSVDAAIECASALSFGSSSNVLCADVKGDAASLEVSPLGVRVLRGEGGTLCHTNHFIAAGTHGWQLELAENLSTEPRLERARLLAGALGVHAIEDVKRLLRDESQGFLSICRHPDPSLVEEARIETVASVVMDLAHATIHVAPDIPSRTEYQPVRVDREAEVLA
ncbi:MAG TPA: C45 family peptidase [Burkholderiales bacterium]|nr:C45 family peptidase [Burkholderiales bacterium]